MSRRSYTIRDIHMALDGELPPDDREDYEVWLAANPDMKALSVRFAADRARLQGVFAPTLKEAIPERMVMLVATGDVPGRSPLLALLGRVPWRAAAVAAVVVASAGIGYLAGLEEARRAENGNQAIVERALQAHTMYAAEKLHVVEVGADQKDHLVGWLSKRVGTPLVAPDLTAEGFSLVGGRLLPASGKPAAQFMYQDRSGTRISLYVTRDAVNEETGFRLYEEEGRRAFYWLDGGFCYAVAGAVPENTLLSIANAAYRQLLEGIAS